VTFLYHLNVANSLNFTMCLLLLKTNGIIKAAQFSVFFLKITLGCQMCSWCPSASDIG